MPESVTDRPTTATEKIFLLTKSQKYFYDNEAVKEPHVRLWGSNNGGSMAKIDHENATNKRVNQGNNHYGNYPLPNPAGRNMRNYWILGPEPFPEAHFATFVSEIPKRAILAGTSQRGACAECGAPWGRVIENNNPSKYAADDDSRGWANTHQKTSNPQSSKSLHRNDGGVYSNSTTLGWRASCSCYGLPIIDDQPVKPAKPTDPKKLEKYKVDLARWKTAIAQWHQDWQRLKPLYDKCATIPCKVLDCFVGSGTTVKVAQDLGRIGIGLDLKPDYLKMARSRAAQLGIPLG